MFAYGSFLTGCVSMIRSVRGRAMSGLVAAPSSKHFYDDLLSLFRGRSLPSMGGIAQWIVTIKNGDYLGIYYFYGRRYGMKFTQRSPGSGEKK